MKKVLGIMMAVAMVAGLAAATEVYSQNVVGYVRVEKPASGGLLMFGNPFITQDQTLNSLADPNQFSGDALDANLADRVIVWNSSTQQYENYALFDARDVEGEDYSEDYPTGWKPPTAFDWDDPVHDPVIPVGSAVWIRGSTDSAENVVFSGEVESAASVTNSVVSGLQLISNPFADSRKLTDFNLHEYAKGDALDANLADRIIVWNSTTQQYDNYALFDARDVEGEDYSEDYPTGWKPPTAFDWDDPISDVEIPVGQGFWLRVVNDAFDWVETNRYLHAFE